MPKYTKKKMDKTREARNQLPSDRALLSDTIRLSLLLTKASQIEGLQNKIRP